MLIIKQFSTYYITDPHPYIYTHMIIITFFRISDEINVKDLILIITQHGLTPGFGTVCPGSSDPQYQFKRPLK